jgi:hypothetical protein
MQSEKINSIGDIDDIMAGIVIETPIAVGIRADTLALEVQTLLDRQYGKDTSNVRTLLSFKKLEDMARAHLRRNFDPEKTGEQEQLAFTEFGDDIQKRYPIKLERSVVEYQSPMFAPVDQLIAIAERDIRVGETRQRRGNALLGFIQQYR